MTEAAARALAAQTRALVEQNFLRPKSTKGKQLKGRLKFRIQAGKAATGPPIGPVFGSAGLKAADFARAFNDKTSALIKPHVELRVKVYHYSDRTYDTFLLPPSTRWFIEQVTKITKFQPDSKRLSGVITPQMLYHIAEFVRPVGDPHSQVEWTFVLAKVAKDMGVMVVDQDTEVKVEVPVVEEKSDDDWMLGPPA
eukprot:NODE_4661_length_778_cov_24.021948_g4317_i0.p1 GENE.NODE_4661_length_778_cov_24.021948_g4317_i0~~NODE_4661_length_778_cov_24.021948_g4317_i0.p1  ORF type:complete len:196 (+),score=43.76 NODE_4661_length_778_cov_24.021948_g4317_i0:140-727(+)